MNVEKVSPTYKIRQIYPMGCDIYNSQHQLRSAHFRWISWAEHDGAAGKFLSYMVAKWRTAGICFCTKSKAWNLDYRFQRKEQTIHHIKFFTCLVSRWEVTRNHEAICEWTTPDMDYRCWWKRRAATHVRRLKPLPGLVTEGRQDCLLSRSRTPLRSNLDHESGWQQPEAIDWRTCTGFQWQSDLVTR